MTLLEASKRGDAVGGWGAPVMLVAFLVVPVSAFLMFVLELATAKALLPRFGGSPMVWTTCMMVYQALLLAGYAYAHALARWGVGRWVLVLHLPVMAVAAGLMIARMRLPAFAGAEAPVMPLLDLILTLGGTIALPFAVVAATSPLVQHWLSRQPSRRPVYILYAVSNLGSFAGLLAYPFLIEPRYDLALQFHLAGLLFLVVMVGMGWLAWYGQAGREASALGVPAGTAPGVAWPVCLLWVALPAASSALLLAVTNELCQDLAVFPFLWVAPLSLYLLSFSLTFRSRPLNNLVAPAAVATLIGMGAASIGMVLPVLVLIVALCALVFLVCLAVHRELYRLRPPVGHLTAYYLWSALGSVVGAAAVTLLPPLWFRGYWEFPLAVLLAWLAILAAVMADAEGCVRRGDGRQAATLLGVVLYLALNQIPEDWLVAGIPGWPGNWSAPLRMGLALALTFALWPLVRRVGRVRAALWPRLLIGIVLLMVECWLVQRVRNDQAGAVQTSRNFFGVVRLQEMVHRATGLTMRQLTHGRINHGFQFVNPGLEREPTAYHSASSGIGRLLRVVQARRETMVVGVTGLGAGALAAYPRRADRIVFYEIDPQVVEAAWGPSAFFGFLNGCPGAVEVVTGDARQSMQCEWVAQGSRRFDVLALDAFSSDAVPTHLLTREAIGLCLEHLADPAGVLAVNISNRFLDLEPVMADSARHFELYATVLDTNGDLPVPVRSIWVLLSRSREMLDAVEIAEAARRLIPVQVAWTDQYSSPFALLKWWSPSARRVPLLPAREDGAIPLEPSPE